jgi:hypothetical protein
LSDEGDSKCICSSASQSTSTLSLIGWIGVAEEASIVGMVNFAHINNVGHHTMTHNFVVDG